MLSGSFGVKKGDVVSFVGGGGKTSLILGLAKELAPRMKVVVTTTTRMGAKELERLETFTDPGALEKGLAPGQSAAFYKAVDGEKVIGFSPDVIDKVAKFSDVVLVEADGARRLPIKVPKPTEPVIAPSTNKLVIVYGFDGLDRPLDDATVYNLDGLLERVPGTKRGQMLTPELLRRIMVEGGFLEHALGRDVFVIINKAELGKERALVFARQLFHPAVRSVAVSSAKEGWLEPVSNREKRIAAVILAAGSAKRFGGGKLLEKVEGRPMIEHVLSASSLPQLFTRILVVGHEKEALLNGLDPKMLQGVQVIFNPDHATGMASSLKTGLRAARGAGADAVMVLLGDMPRVDQCLIARVINAYQDSCAQAARPVHKVVGGHPAVIGKELFPQVERLQGDVGARQVLETARQWTLELDVDPGTQADIDRKEDLRTMDIGPEKKKKASKHR